MGIQGHTHPPGHFSEMQVSQNLGTAHGPTSASPHTPELFAFGASTRDGSDHVLWGALLHPWHHQARTLHQVLTETEFLRGAQGDLCFVS